MNKPIAWQAKSKSFWSTPTKSTLQRACACGNHTVQGGKCGECAKNKSGLQRKFTIGAIDDPLEREADQVAEQVMAVSAHSQINVITPRIQRFSGQTNEGLDAAPASVDRVLASSGRPLEPALQQDMEQHFGYDFSGVRVHHDGEAARAAAGIGARAFTLGDDVAFGAGEYRPGTARTRQLLAHELTHVLQQRGSVAGNVVQAEFALQPTHPLPDEALAPAEADAAIAFNTAQEMEPDEIGDLRDLLSSGRDPEVIDEVFVQAVARYQAQFGLPRTGMLDHATRRQLSREVLAEARTTETFDTDYVPAVTRSLGAFGLEQDDFGFNAKGRYTGLKALRPKVIGQIRQRLATDAGRAHLQENVDLLRSVEDEVSAVALDLPFVLALGARESGVAALFSTSTSLMNTAGKDTHPAGESGMDYFYNQRRAFMDRGQQIAQVTTGFRPGRENRRPALIERRRLLLAFMVKTAQDELTLRRFVAEELTNLPPRPDQAAVGADELFNGLSVDALRSWKALMFAGVGYGQSAVQAVLRAQHAAGEPFSLEAILTLDQTPRVDRARLDRARAVALAALALEGDLRDVR